MPITPPRKYAALTDGWQPRTLHRPKQLIPSKIPALNRPTRGGARLWQLLPARPNGLRNRRREELRQLSGILLRKQRRGARASKWVFKPEPSGFADSMRPAPRSRKKSLPDVGVFFASASICVKREQLVDQV